MDTLSFKTYSAKPKDISKKWVLVDAEGKSLGRVCSVVASILKGKNKPEYTPHMDTGDNVVVINAEKVVLTGKKMTDKEYFHHTGYPGGGRTTTPIEVMEKKPTFVVENAIKGMLPKSKLGRKLLTNVRVFAGPVHNMSAQKPEKIEI